MPGARPIPRSIRSGMERLEHLELLGDVQGAVVGEHHPARADADPLGRRGDRPIISSGEELATIAPPWCSASQ